MFDANFVQRYERHALAGRANCQHACRKQLPETGRPGSASLSHYHSSRKLARSERGPLLSRSFRPTTPLITPGAEVMFMPGFAQFGWLNTLNALISGRRLSRSHRRMYFASETCVIAEPGPMTTPLAALPNEPRAGAANAEASNQRETVR